MQIAENKRIRIFLQDICPPFKHFKDLVYGRNKNPIYYFYFKEDKNLKKIVLFVMALAIISTSFVNVYALDDERESIEGEKYSYVSIVNSSITKNGNTATCKSTIIAVSSVTKIVITQKLQKKVSGEWTNVKTWSKTFNSSTATYTNSKGSLSSGTYRTRTVAKVYKNSNYETVSVNSTTAKIS